MDLHHYIVAWTINNHGDLTDHWEVFPMVTLFDITNGS